MSQDMNDPSMPASEAGQPPAPEQSGPGGGKTSTGLEPPIACLLAYAFGWLSGLIIFLVEKEHREVRYHAAQSLLVFGGLTVLSIAMSVLSSAPFIGVLFFFVSLLVWPVVFVLWIFLMIKGHQMSHVRVPVAGDMAEKMAAS